MIISVCGKTHEGGCEKDIKCFDDSNGEPFQGFANMLYAETYQLLNTDFLDT